MVTPEQRARDGRLAWLIVGTGGVVTLVLVAVIATFLFRQAQRSFDAGLAQAREDAARAKLEAANEGRAPPPPDTATAVGDPARWIGPDDYPATARRAGEEGRVRVTLAVGSDGKPTGCSVALSSGSWSLDNGTCAVMLRNGRFDRARRGEVGYRAGEVRRWTSPVVRWVLPR